MISTMGQRIKSIRQALNLSQEEFGAYFNAGKSYISAVENDKSKLSVDNLSKLLMNKNVSVNFLLGDKGEPFINECENTREIRKNENIVSGIKNWGKRLTQILSEAKTTPYEFSKITGIKENRIEKFMLDSILPGIEEINLIKENVDVSLDWLLYGQSAAQNRPEEQLSESEIKKIKALLRDI